MVTDSLPGIARPRRRLRWLAGVVLVMALLTAGWPLVNASVHDGRPLAAGTRLTVGPGAPNAGLVTVGPGWSILPAQSNPNQGYQLSHGTLKFSVTYAALVGTGQVRRLWSGLRQLLILSNPGVRLSRPTVITSRHGVKGLIGGIRVNGQAGTATTFPSPSGRFAIEMIVLAPARTQHELRLEAMQVVRSLRFAVVRR